MKEAFLRPACLAYILPPLFRGQTKTCVFASAACLRPSPNRWVVFELLPLSPFPRARHSNVHGHCHRMLEHDRRQHASKCVHNDERHA